MTLASPGQRAPAARLAAAVGATYVYRALGAALLALPVVSAVGASGIRSFERGDARLFEPGGLYLLEVIMRSRDLFAESFMPSALLLLVLGFAGLVPEWWLVAALGSSAAPARGLRRLGALALGTWGLRLLAGLLTFGLALIARSSVASARDERWPLLALALVTGLGLLLQAAISFWHDLAEVHVVTGEPPLAAAWAALGLARRAGARLALRYAGAQLLGGCALLGAAAAVGALDVERAETWRSAGAIAIHQVAVLATILLRAAWLWAARRASD